MITNTHYTTINIQLSKQADLLDYFRDFDDPFEMLHKFYCDKNKARTN